VGRELKGVRPLVTKPMFKKILVANRGEIAIRVMRACREMDLATVAVYSEADRFSPHVRAADEAVLIGAAEAAASYLNADRIVEAARRTGAEAIHPGYGFLSENSDFARRCESERLVFIGPNSRALELVGDKVRARQAMDKAGVPTIPGMNSIPPNAADYRRAAQALGYPVLVKASAGGGGKGMRVVSDERGLDAALEAGRREAKSAFGDESVYLEKYLEEPRHVEFQVLADAEGRMVHLFERECSIQRRHQKLIEETPSPALDADLRGRMGETALKVMSAAGYTNAGTVEFLLDKEGRFYFLEVNARLQVEHPVTELVTGVDLVRRQIQVAAGLPLGLRQDELCQRGHAIEGRIYAEDVAQGFLPSSGRVLFLREPQGPGVRLDSGLAPGWEVPVYYDPILAKLIVWAEDRPAACRRLAAALGDYVILGLQTTIEFLRDVISHPEFQAGRLHTGFLGRHFPDWAGQRTDELARRMALAAAAFDQQSRPGVARGRGAAQGPAAIPSPWESLGPWKIGGSDPHGA
jgi:acetyl-CoA carboxylase biotin carboxylase subunit